MAYSLTSANTVRELLAAIVVFAGAQGWTVEYNNASTSTGNGGQIALSSGSCHIAIGENSFNANPIAVTGGQQDAAIFMALATSINTGISRYWGHPGSIVTTGNDVDSVVINDVLGPMTEVHFFGNSEYVWCVVRSAAARYTSFGFGLLNNMGMTGPRVAFCCGGFFPWYDNLVPGGFGFQRRAIVQSNAGNIYWPSMNQQSVGTLLSRSGCAFFVPSGFVDTSIGFPSGDIMPSLTLMETISWFNNQQGVNITGVNMTAYMLDFAIGNLVRNQPVTGGIPLFEIPALMWKDLTLDALVVLGTIPGVRTVNIRDVEPSEEQLYGSEVWKFFPWKQKGLSTDTNQCNTYSNGFAFQKA